MWREQVEKERGREGGGEGGRGAAQVTLVSVLCALSEVLFVRPAFWWWLRVKLGWRHNDCVLLVRSDEGRRAWQLQRDYRVSV